MFNTPEEIFYSVIAGVILMIFLVVIFVLSIVRYQNKLRNHHIEKEKLKHEFSQTLLQSQLEIKDQTLKDIGYELHDNLGQISSLIKINLNTIKLDKPDQASKKIEESKSLLRQLIGDLKALSISLNSDRIAHQGIVEELKLEIEKINRSGQCKAIFLPPDKNPTLDDKTAVITYRMTQEILNNAIKHSKAKQLSVSVEVDNNFCTFVVTDDGVGFDIQQEIKSGGSGLNNLKNRAKLIHAEIEFRSAQGEGTKVIMKVPRNV